MRNFVNTTIIFTILTMAINTSCKSVRKTYEKDIDLYFENYSEMQPVFDSTSTQYLPAPVQNYLNTCGFMGKEIPMNAEVVWSDSHIKMKPGGNWMKIKTLQYNSVRNPFRIAYMKANMFGIIPFEGRDLYVNGSGHMYGKLGNIITVFDEKQKEIAQSALIIILAETLLVPGYALQDYIQWEEMDDYTAAASISHEGITARGIFHFNKDSEFVRFETNDRYYMSSDKGNVLTPFSAEIGHYFQQGDLRIPGSLMAIWHLESGRYEYWKGTISEVNYNIQLR
jgi:hypothetical protein